MKSHWIQPDGTIEIHDPPEEPSLKDMQAFVGGDIEHVSVLFKPPGSTEYMRASMIVNENGHMLKLPFNDQATDVYHNNIRERMQDEGQPYHRDTYPPIVGNAIVFEGMMT